MARRTQRKSDCPIHFALRILGDPWTPLIIRDMALKGKSSYGEFLRSEEGISTNILADRLARLQAEGVLTYETIPRRDTRSAYRLTRKGIDLVAVLLEMIGWSARYDPQTATPRRFVRRLRRDRDALLHGLRAPLLAQIGAVADSGAEAGRGRRDPRNRAGERAERRERR